MGTNRGVRIAAAAVAFTAYATPPAARPQPARTG